MEGKRIKKNICTCASVTLTLFVCVWSSVIRNPKGWPTSFTALRKYQSKGITSLYIYTMASSKQELMPPFPLPTCRWQKGKIEKKTTYADIFYVPFSQKPYQFYKYCVTAKATDDVCNRGTSEYNYLLIFCQEEPWPFTIHASRQLFKELLLLI